MKNYINGHFLSFFLSQICNFFSLYPFIYEWTVKHGGSISAEHGIGNLFVFYLKIIFIFRKNETPLRSPRKRFRGTGHGNQAQEII